MQIRLVGPNGRRVTKAGVIGELLAGGEQVMIGYWGRPGMSRRKIQVIDESDTTRQAICASGMKRGNIISSAARTPR